MPVGSETETSSTEATVEVRDTTGPGGSTQLVDIVISVDPGKVEADGEPDGYSKFDAKKLCAWWHNVSIAPNGSVAKSLKVKRKSGEEYAGPVDVVTVVVSKDGTYFDVTRSCLCDSKGSLVLATGLLARIRKGVFSAVEEFERKLT
jgi:hypothetical protein